VTYVAGRQTQLILDCRRAVKDLKRFRDLEEIWAEELSALKHTTAETERLRMRRLQKERGGELVTMVSPKEFKGCSIA